MVQDVYEDMLIEHNIQPTRIYNVDVSNSSVIQKTPKIFAQTGRKQVGLDKCGQGNTRDCSLLHESIRTLYSPSLYFPMQKIG